MSILKLDRDRYYAVVYGDPIKKTYQDGVFFNGEGNAIDGSQVKKPAPVAVNEPVQVVEQKDEGNAAKIKELKALIRSLAYGMMDDKINKALSK